jgi:hypothetical protein
MKTLVNVCIIGLFGLMAMSSRGIAQTASTAETRLKELNITLPPVPPPIANYVDSVRVGNLLFLAGNTAGPAWKYRGKVGKESYGARRLRHRPSGWTHYVSQSTSGTR